MAQWATIEQVADWIGAPADDRMQQALDAAQRSAEHVRPDLADPTDPGFTDPGADVNLGVIKWAALFYRSRTSPQGFSTYDQFDQQTADYGSAIYEIRQLLGSRKPVAR